MFGLRYTKSINTDSMWFNTKEELLDELAAWLEEGYERKDFVVSVDYTLDEFETYF